MNDKKAAKLIIKRAKKHPELYSEREVYYAKMVRKKIPLSKEIDHKKINLKINDIEFKEGFALNVGNPHIVFFVEDCFKYNLKQIGPLIENHELFP